MMIITMLMAMGTMMMMVMMVVMTMMIIIIIMSMMFMRAQYLQPNQTLTAAISHSSSMFENPEIRQSKWAKRPPEITRRSDR